MTATELIGSITPLERTGPFLPLPRSRMTEAGLLVAPVPAQGESSVARSVLESVVASLEGGCTGLAFGSAVAAIDAVMKLLQWGDEVVAAYDVCGTTYRLFTDVYQKFGIKFCFVNFLDEVQVQTVISNRTKLLWLENPSHALLRVCDLEAIVKKTTDTRCIVCVDNTLSTPVLQQPLLTGADLVLHTAAGFLDGHCDIKAGMAISREAVLGERLREIQQNSGTMLGPLESWLVLRGLETLPLRMRQHSVNALRVARFLSQHPRVAQVYYPGLATHVNHLFANRQAKGCGGTLSFVLEEDTEEAALRLIRSMRLFRLCRDLGGGKSLCCHPATMTHSSIPVAQRKAAGIADSLIRLSVGLEEAIDLINDLDQALLMVRDSEW